MVHVQIGEGSVFPLSPADVSGSNTIQNLLFYNSSEVKVVISLPLSLQQWTSYTTFVDTGVPSLDALKVIDFLDNNNQFTKWYVAMCMRDKSFDDIMSCMSQTGFIISDIEPYLGMKTLNKLILYLKRCVKQDAKNTICWALPLVVDYNKLYSAYKQCQTYQNIFNIPFDVKKTLFDNNIILGNDLCSFSYDSQRIFSGLDNDKYNTDIKLMMPLIDIHASTNNRNDNTDLVSYYVFNINSYVDRSNIYCYVICGVDRVNKNAFTLCL